ncbi:MAG: hypothetical protein J0M25_07455 [Flavobacteriales bacterium]|nr:hypothetical protein [Flavobacteriales bacterium]
MYLSYVGEIFLEEYNRRKNTKFSAEDFFDNILFPLFFDDERHLLHVGNSPFFQRVSDKDIRDYGSKSKAQLYKLKDKIKQNVYSGSIYVGYRAEDIKATTSGQVTDLNMNITPSVAYCSWIGAALGIGVNGGVTLSICDKDVLWSVYEGWNVYREFLNQTPNVKDKQIETWNGHWLCKRLNSGKSLTQDSEEHSIDTEKNNDILSIPTNHWLKIIFALSKKFNKSIHTAYVYSLAQTNQTIGFVNIYLSEITELFEVRDKFFINQGEALLKDKDIMELETQFGFKDACMQGAIGLRSLQPKQYQDYLPKNTNSSFKSDKVKKNLKNQSNFFIIKLWIIAMLNKEELIELAHSLADVLYRYENDKENTSIRGKTVDNHAISDLLEANSIVKFIEKLTNLIPNLSNRSEILKQTELEMVKMSRDNFLLFVALTKFEYTYLKHKRS